MAARYLAARPGRAGPGGGSGTGPWCRYRNKTVFSRRLQKKTEQAEAKEVGYGFEEL